MFLQLSSYLKQEIDLKFNFNFKFGLLNKLNLTGTLMTIAHTAMAVINVRTKKQTFG